MTAALAPLVDAEAPLAELAARCDPGHPEPLWSQLARELERAVRAGVLPAGTLLPSESDLGTITGMSRWVVKRAVTRLAERGLAIRRRGIGTVVVAADEVPEDLLAEELPHESGSVLRRTATTERVRASAAIARALDVRDRDEVLLVTRILHLGEQPVAVLRSHVRARRPVDVEHVVRAGLHAELARGNARPQYGTERIGARPAHAAERLLLGSAPGSWVLAVERTMLSAAGAPVEHAENAYLPEHFRVRSVLR